MDYASSLLGLLPGGRRTPGLKELLASVGTYLPAEQVARIREAAGARGLVRNGDARSGVVKRSPSHAVLAALARQRGAPIVLHAHWATAQTSFSGEPLPRWHGSARECC